MANEDEEYDLETEYDEETLNRIENKKKKIKQDEEKYEIEKKDWVEFFCEYIDYIQNNMNECLTITFGPHIYVENDFNKISFLEGGFDNIFNYQNQNSINFNLGIYEDLFKQFRDGTNQLRNFDKINLLLSYIGEAVLLMADYYKGRTLIELTDFYRKIVVILELAVNPKLFLHYMTGDSSGNTNYIDFKFHGEAKRKRYIGIWLRKQEFLGIITHTGKESLKKFDKGFRLFIRNYIRRLISYMREYNSAYPLTSALPYAKHYNLLEGKLPQLPYNGKYESTNPIDHYYIIPDDWKYIPNILLPAEAAANVTVKTYRHPRYWNNPPPIWWIKRTLQYFPGFRWWNINIQTVDTMSAAMVGTRQLAKWKNLNGVVEENYEAMSNVWEAEYGGGGIKKSSSSSKFKMKKGGFKIISKDIALNPIIHNELKSKLEEYFKLNIVKGNNKNKESHLRDGSYIDNLNISILYSMDKHLPHNKIVKNNATIKKLRATV